MNWVQYDGDVEGPALKRIINYGAFSQRFPIQNIGTQKARKRSSPC